MKEFQIKCVKSTTFGTVQLIDKGGHMVWIASLSNEPLNLTMPQFPQVEPKRAALAIIYALSKLERVHGARL
jgi:hypothetical protein